MDPNTGNQLHFLVKCTKIHSPHSSSRSYLFGDAEAVGARRLEEAEGEEDEGGADVEQVEPVVVDEEVGRQGFLAPRVVRELVVVQAFL